MTEIKNPRHDLTKKYDPTYFKRYFVHTLRSSAFRTAVLTLMTTITVYTSVQPYHFYYGDSQNSEQFHRNISDFSFLPTLVFIAALCIPMLETHLFKHKRSIDLIFPLPITRLETAVSHYISGLIQLVAITLIPTFFASLKLAFSHVDLHIVYIIPMYFFTLLTGIALYSISFFLFGEGNTVGDGVMFVIFTPLALYYFEYGFCNLFDLRSTSILDLVPGLNSILRFPASYYISYLESEAANPAALNSYGISVFIRLAITAVASIFGYLFRFCRFRAEKSGDISDSWFGYRTIIPLLGFSLLTIIHSKKLILFDIFILLFMLIGYFIYRRSFRLKLSDTIILAIALIYALL